VDGEGYHFHMFRMSKGMYPPSIQYVILRMMRTGKYVPSSQYLVRGKPSGGMDVCRANAVWRMLVQPETTTAEDVASVFFDVTTPRDWRYQSGVVRHQRMPRCQTD
jgi:hypothetical protein